MRDKNAITCLSSEDYDEIWNESCSVENSFYLHSINMTYVNCGCNHLSNFGLFFSDILEESNIDNLWHNFFNYN